MLVKIEKLIDKNDTTPRDYFNVIEGVCDSGAFKMSIAKHRGLAHADLYRIKKASESYERFIVSVDDIKKRVEDERSLLALINEMRRLQAKKDYDHCMYRVYEQISDWSSQNRINLCDRLLEVLEVEEYDIHVLLSLLMASFPMRKKLSYRSVFMGRVLAHARLYFSTDEVKDMFVGLE